MKSSFEKFKKILKERLINPIPYQQRTNAAKKVTLFIQSITLVTRVMLYARFYYYYCCVVVVIIIIEEN